MSASSKKKLRKEQAAEQLTERQLAEQKEAKKLKIMTISFTAVMAVILVIALTVGITLGIQNSSFLAKNITAATIGEHKISNAELNYFYIDSINNFYGTYGSYASMFGLDVTAPLDEQILDEETGYTWADDFITSAKENARAVYALADAAEAAGYTLSEDEIAAIDKSLNSLVTNAILSGYGDFDTYLKTMYGNFADEESYRAYFELTTLADSYYNSYSESLIYTNEDLRAVDSENYNAYSSFTYNYYYLNATKFQTGGTVNEDGTTTYSDEEKAAAVAAAEDAAKALTGEDITTVEALDEAISALPINAESETAVTSTLYEDTLYSGITNTDIAEWLADESRKEGDKTYIANTSTTTAEDGTETTVTNGYYVIYFVSCNDNTIGLRSVRHILVQPDGGTYNSTTGMYDYTEEELAAAKEEAEKLYAAWQNGDANEESFAALANEESDDGDGTTGGLYEDLNPATSFVESFMDWTLADHEVGDTEIIQSEYGYHIMYFVSESDVTYRDYMIENELRSNDLTEWYNTLVDAVTVTDGNTWYIRKDLVLGAV